MTKDLDCFNLKRIFSIPRKGTYYDICFSDIDKRLDRGTILVNKETNQNDKNEDDLSILTYILDIEKFNKKN